MNTCMFPSFHFLPPSLLPSFLPPLHPSPTVAPDVTADRQDLVDILLGSTLQLSCTLLGVPPPDSVTWTHNSTTLIPDPDITILSGVTSTSLSRANVADTGGGQYVCSASNVVGSKSDSTEVRVQRECVCFSFKHECEVFVEVFVAVGQDSSQWIQV